MNNIDGDFSGLEKVLLFPREIIKLKHLDVSLISEKDEGILPLVISSEEGNYPAISSGSRSAIVKINGQWFKYKGINIEKALFRDAPYHEPFRHRAPKGGTVESVVNQELSASKEFNRIMQEKGFAIPYQTVGKIIFIQEYEPSLGTFLRHLCLEPHIWIWNGLGSSLKRKKLATSVMEIKGDTRLLEVFNAQVKNEKKTKKVLYKLGVIAGVQKRAIYQQFCHQYQHATPENWVVFREEGNITISLTDLDYSFRPSEYLAKPLCYAEILVTILQTLRYSIMKSDSSKENHYPKKLALSFLKGFLDGYRNKEKISEIPESEFWQGFYEPDFKKFTSYIK
jgi:hypothetical protein